MFKKYLAPAFYFIGFSLVGLDYSVGYILILALFVYLWRLSPTDKLLIIYILTFNLGLSSDDKIFMGIKSYDILIPIIILTYFVNSSFTYSGYLKKTMYFFLIFLAINLIIQIVSPDNIISKIAGFRNFFGFFFIFVPFAIFNDNNFNFEIIIKRIIEYWTILGILIVLQSIIIKMPIFITYMNKTTPTSYYADFILRVYPVPFQFIIFYLFWLNKTRIKYLPLLVTILALIGSLNRSLWIASFFIYYIGANNIKKLYNILALAVFIFVGLLIELKFGYNLRILDIYYQFSDVFNNKGMDSLNNLGTGRYLQAINPLLVFSQKFNIFFGVGFISSLKSTVNSYFSSIFIGENRFITEVEIGQVSYFISGGLIGFMNLFLLFFKIWRLLKHLTYFKLFKQTLLFIILLQIGGFFTFLSSSTWGLLGLVIGLILINDKNELFLRKNI